MSVVGDPVLRAVGARVAPLSFAQERLWFVDAAAPGSATYNVPLLLTWSERVDPDALASALGALLDRHDVLRTGYHLRDGVPVQEIADDVRVPLEVVRPEGDPSDLAGRVRADALRRAAVGFDLRVAPPLRCTVWTGLPDGDVVLLTVHHIALDGWSLASLLDDLAEAYRVALTGRTPRLPRPGVQYADFAVWDRQVFGTPAVQALVEDRVAALREVPGGLVLGGPVPGGLEPGPGRPGAGTRATEGSRPGRQHVFEIPPDLWTAVDDLARRLHATPFVVLLAAYQVVLQRWSGRDAFLLGTVVANRPHPEVEDLVGFFVNTVPLRCAPRPEWSFAELCREVRGEAFGSLTWQRIPFDQLSRRLAGAGATGTGAGPGLVPVGFALQNMPAPGPNGRWGTPELLPTGTAKFDLVLIVEDDAEGRRGRIEFDTDVYSPALAARLGDAYLTLLGAAVADPGTSVPRLPLTPGGGSGRLDGPGQDLDGATSVVELVTRRIARADPDAPAVSAAGRSSTWREFDAWSRAVAAALRGRGVGPGRFVPVLSSRSPALAAAWFGVLRTGAAYAPLSLDTPTDRLRHILAELSASVLVADREGADLIAGYGLDVDVLVVDDVRPLPGAPAPDARAVPDAVPAAQDPAVVIYTSGTTGRPKGVLVPHGGLLNTALWWAGDCDLGPADRLLTTWSTSFDGATHEVFRSLLAGSELVLADDVERRDPQALARLVRRATVTSMTPSLLRAVLDADADADAGRDRAGTLRVLYVGGEGLPAALAQECVRRWQVPMRNIYGPTEASCISTWAPVDTADGRPPAIGWPLPNTRAYVLGPAQEELPPGVPGELYVAGAGVALGYLDQPDRAAAVFLPDPHATVDPADAGPGAGPPARMYRTGDRVVLRDDGLIEYLGRVDDQVKIVGNRVETGEVRTLLEEQPAVRAAAVRAEGDPARLVAWVELAAQGPLPTRDEVLRPLLRWLPAAVLPAQVYVVDALPMTGNDKTDLDALGAMRSVPLPSRTEAPVPLTGARRRAADAFLAALADPPPADGLGPDTDFFTLGGHSLLAVRMLAALDPPVALRDFLAEPTVAGLGALLERAPAPPAEAQTPGAESPGAESRFPATPVQQRFWFIDRVAALRTAYLAPVVTEFTGDVDPAALRRAAALVLARHPALRSRFELDLGRRRVYYRTDGTPPEVTLTDARGWPPERLAQHLAAACWTPFDLARDAPARADVVAAGGRTLLVTTAHHIVADGWSHAVLGEQLAAAYRADVGGRPADLPPAVHPAAVTPPPPDGAAPVTRLVAEVVDALAGAPVDVDLPHDRERPEIQPTLGRTVTRTLEAPVAARLRALAAGAGGTAFVTTAAALAVVLARRSTQRDFLFAFPWAGREVPGRPGVDVADAVGMFVNTLLLRVDLTGDPTWREVLGRVREQATRSFRTAEVPFQDVAAALQPGRDLSRPPVTPVYLTTAHEPPVPLDLGPGTSSRHLPPDPLHVKYELELTATELPATGRTEFSLAHSVALFDESTATRLLDELCGAAAELAATPDAPALKSPAARGPSTVSSTETGPVTGETSPLEQVREAWAEVLDAGTVSDDQNFFDAGGDSLLLIVLLERLNGLTDRDLEAADLFRHSTVRSQAALLGAPASGGERELARLGAGNRRGIVGRARRGEVAE